MAKRPATLTAPPDRCDRWWPSVDFGLERLLAQNAGGHAYPPNSKTLRRLPASAISCSGILRH